MKISDVLRVPSLRVLFFIVERKEVRYADLAKLIGSRGTLSVVLRELEDEGLLTRRVVAKRPIEAHYSLTLLGNDVTTHLARARTELSRGKDDEPKESHS